MLVAAPMCEGCFSVMFTYALPVLYFNSDAGASGRIAVADV